VTEAGARGTTILALPLALCRAISNLVDNAIKYGGGAEIGLASEAGRTVVAVEDRGPGIPRSEHDKVLVRSTRSKARAIRTPAASVSGSPWPAQCVRPRGAG
jgi:signal transduction histidine kinase